jgi:hypothetical protein
VRDAVLELEREIDTSDDEFEGLQVELWRDVQWRLRRDPQDEELRRARMFLYDPVAWIEDAREWGPLPRALSDRQLKLLTEAACFLQGSPPPSCNGVTWYPVVEAVLVHISRVNPDDIERPIAYVRDLTRSMTPDRVRAALAGAPRVSKFEGSADPRLRRTLADLSDDLSA